MQIWYIQLIFLPRNFLSPNFPRIEMVDTRTHRAVVKRRSTQCRAKYLDSFSFDFVWAFERRTLHITHISGRDKRTLAYLPFTSVIKFYIFIQPQEFDLNFPVFKFAGSVVRTSA